MIEQCGEKARRGNCRFHQRTLSPNQALSIDGRKPGHNCGQLREERELIVAIEELQRIVGHSRGYQGFVVVHQQALLPRASLIDGERAGKNDQVTDGRPVQHALPIKHPDQGIAFR